MVPSSAITITVDCECLTCGGFSLGETICLGNFEFITKYFDDPSLSPRRGYAGVAFMGSTPRWAMMEDSAEEFLMASSREGSFAPPPSPKKSSTEALPAPVATTPWLKDILDIAATQQAESSL
jgi:hypothetical protein